MHFFVEFFQAFIMSGGRLSNISPTQNCAKVFVQRDYSHGTMVRFMTQLPDELEDKVRTKSN